MGLWIYDAGHGEDTPGKRSPNIPPGIFEWEFNRAIVRGVKEALEGQNGIEIMELVPSNLSVPLKERVYSINHAAAASQFGGRKPVYSVSCHANAADEPGWSNAKGVAVFCRAKKAKPIGIIDDAHFIANIFLDSLAKATSFKRRGVIERGFNILMGKVPSILVEHGFMTNLSDAKFMASQEGREAIIGGHVQAILKVESRFK